MALPPTFSNRVRLQAGRVADRYAAPSVLGQVASVVGRTMGQIGEQDAEAERQIAASQQRVREREIARDRQAADIGYFEQYAARGTARRAAEAELEQGVATGGQGHVDAVQKLFEQDEAWLATIGDEETALKYRQMWAQDKARELGRAEAFAGVKRADAQVRNYTGARDELNNGLMQPGATPDDLALARTRMRGVAGDLGLVGERADQVNAETDRLLTLGWMQGQLQAGKQSGVKAILDQGGEIDTILSPDDRKRLLAQVDAGDRADAAETAQRANAARVAAKETLDTLSAQIAEGATPSPADMMKARQVAAAAGVDGDDLARFDGRIAAVAVNRTYAALPVSRLYHDRDVILANPKATAQEQMMARQIGALIEKKEKEQAAGYKDAYAEGAAGQIAVAAQLDRLPAQERRGTAERIAKGFGFVVMLPSGAREDAIYGWAERKADKDLVPQEDARAAWQAAVGGAFSRLNGDATKAMFEAANSVYAMDAKRRGLKAFDTDLYASSVERVLGSGTADWNEDKVILPDGVSARQFYQMAQRAPFGDAVSADGRPVGKADVLRSYTPRFIDQNGSVAIYQWFDASGRPLGHKGGGAYNYLVPTP